ncbi:MAG: YjbQ family protein [Deltaproteobacteria bacterium]|nr:YjbQ family protein [Deltaproteobacteria bacterium]
MITTCESFEIDTEGDSQILDITGHVTRIVKSGLLQEGLATIFVPGATASVSTIEFEPGAVADLKAAVERIAPKDIPYRHDVRWGDGNGFSHVRAALLGPSLSIPVSEGQLMLGTWQQIVLLDHDNRPRNRRVLVQLLGRGAS